MHDIVIRNGTIVDGTGSAAHTGDVAVADGKIVAVGDDVGPARRELDAEGNLVLPGWVDVHTHYDGQATWDPHLTPSSWHGVTTAVFGNCGVGFAPLRPGTEDFLINLMEGVEDIPGSVLAEGIDFSWESFPQYLDALDRPHVADIGTQIPHGAVRVYVMGERGADHTETPTTAEIGEMGRIVAEAITAGALGFSTSRTIKHKAADGRQTPSLSASDAELLGVARAMAEIDAGVLQCNSDFGPGEIERLTRIVAETGRPLSVLLLQTDHEPDLWRQTLAGIRSAQEAGLPILGQVGCRPIGILMGLEASVHPFGAHPAFRELADLPAAERVQRLRSDESLRHRLIHELPSDGFTTWTAGALEKTFELREPLDYEPAPEASIAARARQMGCSPHELALDLFLENDGQNLLLHPFENYAEGSLDAIREMLVDPHTIMGLSDGGAHVGTICDASYPTFLLTHWARDRSRGEGIPLEQVVRKQTRDTARAYGLHDRGVLAPGYKADINVIDFENLRLLQPEMRYDLPAGGKRLVQQVEGYRHTFVSGVEVASGGEATGELPGALIRGGSAG